MSDTGRYYIADEKTGRVFCVEPIGNSSGHHQIWGDVDPASKTIGGNYGEKYKGAINKEDSIITEENGFTNIATLKSGQSPKDYINLLLREIEHYNNNLPSKK